MGEILDGAVKIYRARWKPLLAIVAVLVVPFNFIEAYLTRTAPSFFTGEPSTFASGEDLVLLAVLGVSYVLLIIPLLTAAVAHASVNASLGKQVNVGGTLRFALPLAPSLLWILLLTFLAILLGLLLLVIPGIIAMIRLSFAPIVRVTEGLRGGAAISRSWRLSAGYFWKILGTVLVAIVLTAFLAGLFIFPTELLVAHIGPDAWVLSAIGGSIADTVTTPYITLVTVLLYLDLRVRKERFDLEVMEEELERLDDRE